MKIFFAQLRLWLLKLTKPLRSFILWILLNQKQHEAIWRQKQTGVTQYVVVTGWHSVYVFDKTKYNSLRKYLLKTTGKDLKDNVKWRATGTLQRNLDYCPKVERL